MSYAYKGVILSSPTAKKLMEMFNLMLDHFGPQQWWPGDTALEIMVGAVLTQNTNWNNVEKAISNLKNRKILSLEALYSASSEELAKEIRPAGYYNIKAKRLKNLVNYLHEYHEGSIDIFLTQDTPDMREGLLSVNGVGPETADSILLYAAERPVFVIDAYTHRILNRHELYEDQASYYDLQAYFMDNLPDDEALFNEFHALIVMTGKEFCRKSPRCEECPLEKW